MKIVADRNIPLLPESFGRRGDVRAVDGRALRRADLADAQVLLVRSVTRVDARLLQGTPVRFVASATIGTDHLDTAWLDAEGIRWAHAPGCNADAAAQYTLGMMLLACRRLRRRLEDQRVGIIGRGNVGSRLQKLLQALGVPTLACDPPLAAAGEPGLAPLAEALACPVVTLHVPLTSTGRWPTAGMIDASAVDALPRGALLVNAARGGVVSEPVLRQALDCGRLHAALDVWPREPAIDPDLLRAVTVASPHVAGYSVEGKRRGTRMIYEAFLSWLGERPDPSEVEALEHLGIRERIDLDPLVEAPVERAVLEACHVPRDDRGLRHAESLDAATFDALRRAHGPRHEFARIAVEGAGPAAPLLAALGFATRSAKASQA
ncbi:MAG: 4-phosphoerythronate dehydrogenase [Gammaproteobacteria bacterium]